MSPRPAQLERGLREAEKRRKRHAKQRVRAYRAWVAKGSPVHKGATVPEIPSDCDYKTTRGETC